MDINLDDIESDKHYNLERLQTFLSYQLSGTFLFVLSFFWGITLLLAVLAAIIFIPFMLKVLYQEERFGWIIFFCIIVLLPLIFFFIFLRDSNYLFVFGLLSLAFFYMYCFILRLSIGDWFD